MLPAVCVRNSLESLFQKEELRGFVVWGHPERIAMRPYTDLPCHPSGRAGGQSLVDAGPNPKKVQGHIPAEGLGVSPRLLCSSPKIGGRGVDDSLLGHHSEAERQLDGD